MTTGPTFVPEEQHQEISSSFAGQFSLSAPKKPTLIITPAGSGVMSFLKNWVQKACEQSGGSFGDNKNIVHLNNSNDIVFTGAGTKENVATEREQVKTSLQEVLKTPSSVVVFDRRFSADKNLSIELATQNQLDGIRFEDAHMVVVAAPEDADSLQPSVLEQFNVIVFGVTPQPLGVDGFSRWREDNQKTKTNAVKPSTGYSPS